MRFLQYARRVGKADFFQIKIHCCGSFVKGGAEGRKGFPDVKYWVNNGKTSSPRTAFTALEQLKQAHPGITAVLTWGDIYAAGALQYLYQQNLRVPQDVEVVTCGDTLMPYLAPAISSVEVPLREMARTAVAIINDQLADGQKDFVKTVTLEPLFTRRGV